MIQNSNLFTNKFLINIILFIIVFSFLFTGISSYFINYSKDDVAFINDTVITKFQLENAIQEEQELLNESIDSNSLLTSKEKLELLKYQALQRLINITLLNQYGKKIGIHITDKEIQENIFKMPIFYDKNGVFNNKIYRTILKKNNINAEDFAEQIKKNLINLFLYNFFVFNEFSLPQESFDYAKLLFQKREIQILTIPIQQYQKNQIVSENELLKFYNLNKDTFLVPKKVKLNYINLNVDNLKKKIVIDNDLVLKYYKDNIKNFLNPIEKHYTIIEFKTEKEGKEVLKKINNNIRFHDLLLDKSISFNKRVIGWVNLYNTPREILNLNLTKKYQTSDLLKINKKYIIVHLDDIKPSTIKPFNTVKDSILDFLKNKFALKKIYFIKQEINKIKNKKDFSKYLENISNVKFIKTDWFDLNHIPEELKFDKIYDFIVKVNKKNKNFKIFEINNEKLIIFNIDDYKSEYIPEFNVLKNEISELIKFDKAEKELDHLSKKILLDLKEKKFSSLLKEKKLYFEKPIIVDRFKFNKKLSDEIFLIPIPKNNVPNFSITKDANKNYLIIQLNQVFEINTEKNKLYDYINLYKNILGSVIIESLLENLRNQSKIIIKI
ncbi:MAG: SurA N-terminal domain-containing protein [Arsenophonus sp.]|nr:MAG: SurA N-terminal domain-containing protein [Arsenophonus sp.]